MNPFNPTPKDTNMCLNLQPSNSTKALESGFARSMAAHIHGSSLYWSTGLPMTNSRTYSLALQDCIYDSVMPAPALSPSLSLLGSNHWTPGSFPQLISPVTVFTDVSSPTSPLDIRPNTMLVHPSKFLHKHSFKFRIPPNTDEKFTSRCFARDHDPLLAVPL